jgi:hypothetical protein
MYTPVLLLTISQQDSPAKKAGKNVDHTLEEAGKKNKKTGEAIKDKVENGASLLDGASVNYGY